MAEEPPTANLQYVFREETNEKSPSSDSSRIQIESVPIDYILLGSSEMLAPNTSEKSPIVLPPSDTVTPNPKRKCFESVFPTEKEKESEDTPRPNFQRVNEAFVEIIANLRRRFPLCRGLHRSLCTGDDRLRSNRPKFNDYGGKDVKITAISPNILCLARTENNVPMMDSFQTQWFVENTESCIKAYFGLDAKALPYYQRIVDAFCTRRDSLYFAKNEQPICLRKRISYSKPYETYFLQSIACQTGKDAGAVTQFEFVLVDSNRFSLRIFFPKSKTLIRIINCDKNEMNRPVLQLNDSEIFDRRIRASQSELYVCGELDNLLKGFEWSLKRCLENPAANGCMTWITEKCNIIASSSCSELFPRLNPPTNSAPYRVVCQLWKDLTRFSFANFDASLSVSHAGFPLQVLEVPVSETVM
ncbi:uncharacterized protein NPIL_311201 [Nephila pilipes]|uniref:Uncharacterized protein n=1 Tax=Nephila pilipes TaxID=299642 RepID=A0A8X6NSS5_NEPPI|nr:uncharacterized protein NPIL_311201 [Nephila pilipes]